MNLKTLLFKANSKIEPAMLHALISVETGGKGFASDTGYLIIQFEPKWFKRKAPYAPSGLWSLNGVERQKEEYKAFSDAFKKDANAAMESTSIGLPQIMGFHYKRLGFNTVGQMWDYFKVSEDNQVLAMIRFLESDPVLYKAILNKDFKTIADCYNGKGWPELAAKLGREPYPISLEKAYKSYRG